MLLNHIKFGIRKLLRAPVVSSLNILGLSIGVASSLLIFIYVFHELSYDKFHADKERVFRIIQERTTQQDITYSAFSPGALAPALNDQFPEIEYAARFFQARRTLLRYGDKEFFEDKGIYAEPEIFDILSLKFLVGNPNQALNEPNQIVINEKIAEKYFGPGWRQMDILNHQFTVSGRLNFAITGVVENSSENFHLDFDFICSFETSKNFLDERYFEFWGTYMFYTYFKVEEDTDITNLERKLEDFAAREMDPITQDIGYTINFIAQPLEKIHLYSAHFRNDMADRGDIQQVIILVLTGVSILILASLNFINLTTAGASQRAREVGIRKVNGATRQKLVLQYLSETFIITSFAFLLSALIVELVTPVFNFAFGVSLSFSFTDNWQTPLFFFSLWFLISTLAGIYPAVYLSGFSVQKSLKEIVNNPGSGSYALRKGLVIFQLIITTFLLMFTVVIYQQVKFMQNKELGFSSSQVMVAPIRSLDLQRNLKTAKTELQRIPEVENVAANAGLPGYITYGDEIGVPEKGIKLSVRMMFADEDLIPTLGMEMASGRNFSDQQNDLLTAFIINETAAKHLGWENEEAIGKKVEWDIWVEGDTLKRGEIIGVVKDFHYQGMKQVIEPLVFHIYPPQYSALAIKLTLENLPAAIESVEAVLRTWNNDLPVDFHFLDEDFERFYQTETEFSTISQLFTVLAVVVACLGLLGLSIFITNQQLKSVSIRKVFGATAFQIFILLNSFYFRLSLVAAIIGLPLSYIFAQRWLSNYAYKINLGLGPVSFVLLIMLVISVMTISFQAARASVLNPTTILRNE